MVTVVSAVQRKDGSKIMDVTYDFSSTNNRACEVRLYYSMDDGASYKWATAVSGDVGLGVQPGTGKQIVWSLATDLGDVETTISVRVTAFDWGGQPLQMVSIPAGSFQMGSTTGSSFERPVHTVTISAFQMSKYEITQARYVVVIGSNPSYFTGDGSRPVERVSWHDAVTFCNALSVSAGLEICYNLSTWECDFTKNGYRLPTEAEWEYACRAGTTTKYYTGDSESDLARAGWYKSNSGNTTHPVGEKTPNDWGLHDMHGNVWEFCNDWYEGNYYSVSPPQDPTGPVLGSARVRRGGSWYFRYEYCRSASRIPYYPSGRNGDVGFRVVRR